MLEDGDPVDGVTPVAPPAARVVVAEKELGSNPERFF